MLLINGFCSLLEFNYSRIFNKAIYSKLKGSFEDTSASPKTFDDPSKHLLVQFTTGNPFQREKLLNHPELESLLYVQKGKLYQLFIPRTLCTYEDSDTPTSKVAGVLGRNVDKYNIISFSNTEILGDFWSYVPNTTRDSIFLGGTDMDNDIFEVKDASSEHDAVTIDAEGQEVKHYDYPCSPPVIIGSVPFCIPKLRGVTITTGSLQSGEVLDSLKNYHQAAYLWAMAVKHHTKNTKKYKISTMDNKFYPFLSHDYETYLERDSMIVPTIEDSEAETYRAVENDISLIKSVSQVHKKESNTNAYRTPDRAYPLSPVPPPSGASSVASTSTVVAVKEKNIRTIAFYKIFFSAKILNEENNIPDLYLGSISEDFTEALEASSKTESIFKFKTALDTRLIEKTKSESYLDRNIELPNVSDTLVALILNCMFHKHLLDQNTDLLNKRVSVLNFLAKPEYGQSKEEYKKFISRNNHSEMEGVVDEAVEKRSVKDKTVFTKGRQETLQDIITALANFIFVLEFLCNPDDLAETPGILSMLHKMARKITEPDFKEFYNHNKYEMPWIPYSILCHIQSIIKAHALAASDVHTLRYVESDGVPDPRILSLANTQFEYIINNYDLCISTNNPGFFASKPIGYVSKRKADKEISNNAFQKRDRPNNDNGSSLKKGWLTTTGDIKFPELRHSKRPCLFFIIEGKSCRKRGSECAYEHKTYPRGFKKQDQATICKWVAETPHVQFSSAVLDKDKNVTWTPAPPSSKTNETKEKEGKDDNVSDETDENETIETTNE